MLDYRQFEALTFDCYGTLIDWETGLVAAFSRALSRQYAADDLLARFAAHEARLEAGPYVRYRDVVAEALRGVAGELDERPTASAVAEFAASVGQWPAFPDSPSALARLKTRFKLAVITNCDNDLFAASNARLGVTFDWVVTAEQVGSYKPSEANFVTAFERLAIPRERILHVAQSLFHDHVPARRLGLRTVWINRRAGRQGAGATPPAEVVPDATFPDLASFADAALV